MKKKNLNTIKSTGFKTPGNYFNTFEDKLLSRLEESEPIEGIQDTGFKIPEDYFDSLENNIFEKLEDSDTTKVINLKSRKRFYYIAGIAASLLLLLAIYVNTKSVDPISVEMVESYFENSDLDSYELAQLLDEADLLDENFDIIEPSFDEELIEDYLLENTDIESYLE